MVGRGSYTVEKGSTIVTFKPEYIKTLQDGEHTVRMVFTDGYSVAKWNIVSNGAPDTGDAAGTLPFVLLIAAACATAVIARAYKKKSRG